MIRLAVALALAVLLPALPANARLLDDMHEHDGFFLRFHLGGGSMNAKWNDFAFSQTASGPSGSFSFALGGAVAPNLILFGELTSESASNPRFRINGDDYRSRDVALSQSGFGPGLAYYFMPVNMYVSGTLLFTRGTMEVRGVEDQTDLGYGFKFALGKEWWVSRDWGLGVAGIASIANLPVDSGSVSFNNFGLAFTATYN